MPTQKDFLQSLLRFDCYLTFFSTAQRRKKSSSKTQVRTGETNLYIFHKHAADSVNRQTAELN